MKQLRCETCGAPLELSEDGLHAKCAVCGNFYEYRNPKEEYWVEQMNEANELRQTMDFDSAIKKYSLILKNIEGDAEVEWGLLLSKYGISYEIDPLTEEYIPTFHRNRRENILHDSSAERAVSLASDRQKTVYERELQRLRHIQEGIEALAEKSEAYDVFVSFKATENGTDDVKTIDRDIAYNIYDELNGRGIKTFFSEATLQDMASVDYEAVIFNALNTCKVFILVGTSRENINATWVKNEWSRYRERLIEDQKNGGIASSHFAVVGGDMKPSDLPPLFARTQNIMLKNYAGDSYKKDIAASVCAILGIDKSEKKSSVSEDSVKDLVSKMIKNSQATGDGNTVGGKIENLLKAAKIALESDDYAECKDKANAVINLDAENVDAYMYRLLADMEVSSFENLAETKKQMSRNSNYKALMKLAPDDIKEQLTHYNDLYNQRVRDKKKYDEYMDAKDMIEREGYRLDDALKKMESYGDYLDAKSILKAYNDKQRAKKHIEIDNAYELAVIRYKGIAPKLSNCKEEIDSYELNTAMGNSEKVVNLLEECGDLDDSRLAECRGYIDCIRKYKEERANYKKLCEERAEKHDKIIKITFITLAVLAVIAIVLALAFAPLPYIWKNGVTYRYIAKEDAYHADYINSVYELVLSPVIRGKRVIEVENAIRNADIDDIRLTKEDEHWKVIDHYLIYDNTLIMISGKTEKVILPDTITKIEYDSCSNNDSLKYFYIPKSVTQIGVNAIVGKNVLVETAWEKRPEGWYYYKDRWGMGAYWYNGDVNWGVPAPTQE